MAFCRLKRTFRLNNICWALMQSKAISVFLNHAALPPRNGANVSAPRLPHLSVTHEACFLGENGIFVSLSPAAAFGRGLAGALTVQAPGEGPGHHLSALLFLSFLATQQYSRVLERGRGRGERGRACH